jgi:hypothetical protein
MDMKDEPFQSEDTNTDKMKFDHIGSNRGGEDKGDVGIDYEALRVSTKVEVKGLGNKAIITGCIPISLGDPDFMRRKSMIKRPNNRAEVIFQNVILKVRTRLKCWSGCPVARIFRDVGCRSHVNAIFIC